jgi:integrase
MSRGTVRGWLPHNVLAGVSDSQVFRPAVEVNYARLSIDEMPAFYRALSLYDGSTRMRIATKLLAYTFTRNGELIQARWAQFDLDAALWIIPANVMKTRKTHLVPLASQVVLMLHRLKQANNLKYGQHGVEDSEFLFPGDRDSKKSISNNAILAVIHALGYKRREFEFEFPPF